MSTIVKKKAAQPTLNRATKDASRIGDSHHDDNSTMDCAISLHKNEWKPSIRPHFAEFQIHGYQGAWRPSRAPKQNHFDNFESKQWRPCRKHISPWLSSLEKWKPSIKVDYEEGGHHVVKSEWKPCRRYIPTKPSREYTRKSIHRYIPEYKAVERSWRPSRVSTYHVENQWPIPFKDPIGTTSFIPEVYEKNYSRLRKGNEDYENLHPKFHLSWPQNRNLSKGVQNYSTPFVTPYALEKVEYDQGKYDLQKLGARLYIPEGHISHISSPGCISNGPNSNRKPSRAHFCMGHEYDSVFERNVLCGHVNLEDEFHLYVPRSTLHTFAPAASLNKDVINGRFSRDAPKCYLQGIGKSEAQTQFSNVKNYKDFKRARASAIEGFERNRKHCEGHNSVLCNFLYECKDMNAK